MIWSDCTALAEEVRAGLARSARAVARASPASPKGEPWEIHGQPFRARFLAPVGEADHEHDPDSFPPVTPRSDSPVTREDLGRAGRAFEYALRDELRPLARGRVRGCGRTKVTQAAWVKGVGEDVEVWSREHDELEDGEVEPGKTRRAYYRNILTCGSAWECPSCMARHRRAGANKVKLAVERWQDGFQVGTTRVDAHGAGSVLFFTLTVRHGLGDDLRVVRKGVTDAFSRMIAGRAWTQFCGVSGMVPGGYIPYFDDIQAAANANKRGAREVTNFVHGYVRALEVTHGPNGWHPHVHGLMFCDVSPSEKTLQRMRKWLSDRWRKAVRAVLGADHEPDDEHGVDLRPCGAADYIAKLGLELSSSSTKEGKKALHRAPIEIAKDYATTHDATDGKLWQDYCAGMKGARMLTWSGDLLDRLGLVEEDEPAGEIEPQLVASIDDVTWHRVRDLRGAKLAILVAAEENGADGVRDVLAYMVAHGKAPPRASAQRAGPS